MKQRLEAAIFAITAAFVLVAVICCGADKKVTQAQISPDTACYNEASREEIDAALLQGAHKIENCVLTAYCPCVECCGKYDGVTASGKIAQENHTVAVDPDVIPIWGVVYINGKWYQAEDVGGAVQGNMIDIYFSNHEEALAFGRQTAEVYWMEG